MDEQHGQQPALSWTTDRQLVAAVGHGERTKCVELEHPRCPIGFVWAPRCTIAVAILWQCESAAVAFPTAADERAHAPGDEPEWAESWNFEFFTDGGVGGYVTVTLLPAHAVAWYWAALVGHGDGLVAVLDDDVPLPRPAGSLELRTEGLWADHVCEVPLDHWTLGNEAFALRFDDPDEVFGRQRGDRVPLGFDLEWETAGPVAGSGPGYAVPCLVHGVVLIEADRLAIDGWGWRSHRWGVPDWSDDVLTGRLDDGTWVSDPSAVDVIDAVRAPVAAGGVRVVRSLARIRASDGRTGRGWLTRPAG
jgi:hypothetical protein